MPQGGIDQGEDSVTAVKREIFEETNIKNIKILKEIDKIFEYELPKKFGGVIWKVNLEGRNKNGLL